jgi:hypothetical protein
MQNHQQWLKSVKPEVGNYIAGFVDGEGSFNVSLKKLEGHPLGWKVVPSFNVSQRDRVILAFLKSTLGCGTLRTRQDGVVYYEVHNVNSMVDRVIPFFERFRFRSATKKKNFAIFKKIVLILHKEGLNEQTLRQTVQLRETLNEGRGRTRKYGARHVLRKSSETTRRTSDHISE